MATESAVISCGFTQSGASKKAGSATAVVQAGATQSANQYAGGSGLISSDVAAGALPKAHIPFGRVRPDGTVEVDPVWYRFLDYVVNTQLGGPTGPTLGDISDTVESTRSSAINAQNAVSVVAQTVNANASALAATVQVAQTNNLSGAKQIPAISYTVKGIQR
ncbi:MAG: hypothetical protein PVS3B2_00370 [Candidatus Dormibacteraceae bacterium]